jgi:hypothetical protein
MLTGPAQDCYTTVPEYFFKFYDCVYFIYVVYSYILKTVILQD